MKKIIPLVATTLMCSLITLDAEARGGGGGGGGAGRGQGGGAGGGAQRGGGGGGGGGAAAAKRNPMSGSKMNRPAQQPQAKPATRPAGGGGGNATRPGTLPGAGGGNNQRPGTLPGAGGGGNQRPGTLPGAGSGNNQRPGTLPGAGGGGTQRPNTKPGNVNYPKPGNRPNGGNNNVVRPGGGNNNTVVRPGGGNKIVNNRPVINRPTTLPANKAKWGNNWGSWGNWNKPGRGKGNVNIVGNGNNITINNNFQKNVNWGYKPNYWGSRPWWSANQCHGWHHGSWNYGWNKAWYGHYHYYRPRPYPGYVIVDNDNDFAQGVAWGIAAWGLGNLIYNSGYQSYQNPYPTPPVQSGNTTIINYSEPLSVSAGKMPPGDETTENTAEEKSSAALDASRAAFKTGDYLAALKSVDEAIAAVPGDTAIHEYRALILFALGKYGEAAGVLNPVLASGPGWDWTTMTGLYPSQSVYTGQLRKLEDYAKSKANDAAPHFLLGYHYMVCSHIEKAYEEFDKTVKLQPADSIAAQLRDLCKSSVSPDGDGDAAPEAPAVEKEAPAPVAADKLPGTWVSDRGDQGKVTLKLGEDGAFSWSFSKGGQTSDLTGTFTIDEKGLLVLASEDSQMVGEIKLPEDKKLNFVLAGGPQGDPGLTFNKAP